MCVSVCTLAVETQNDDHLFFLMPPLLFDGREKCAPHTNTHAFDYLFVWINPVQIDLFISIVCQTNLWGYDMIECCGIECVIISRHRPIFIFDQQLGAFIGIIADAAHLWTFTSIRWIRIARTVWFGTTATATTTAWARATITFAVFTAWRIIMICCCIRSDFFAVVHVWRFVMMWSVVIMMSTVSTSDIGHLTTQFCEINTKTMNSFNIST